MTAHFPWPVCKELIQSSSKWGSPTAVNRPICHLKALRLKGGGSDMYFSCAGRSW